MNNMELWGMNTENKVLNTYKFNTIIDYYSRGKIMVVDDICRHYSLDEAKESIIKWNEDRGFKVLKIELQ